MADLKKIFSELKKILSKYEKSLNVITDKEERYEIEFKREFTVKSSKTGREIKKSGLYFAGLIIQSSYVGLYLMPVYSHEKDFKGISDRLKKIKKGKSCFHVKTDDQAILKELKSVISKGYSIYKTYKTEK